MSFFVDFKKNLAIIHFHLLSGSLLSTFVVKNISMGTPKVRPKQVEENSQRRKAKFNSEKLWSGHVRLLKRAPWIECFFFKKDILPSLDSRTSAHPETRWGQQFPSFWTLIVEASVALWSRCTLILSMILAYFHVIWQWFSRLCNICQILQL